MYKQFIHIINSYSINYKSYGYYAVKKLKEFNIPIPEHPNFENPNFENPDEASATVKSQRYNTLIKTQESQLEYSEINKV